jgi:DNA-binding SARP family transcriptional activator/Tfp pilus assembly protein PilF
VRILGPFSVERDGVALDMGRWQRRMARLFKLLVVAPHRQRTRDEIIALLWPDASEEAGGANLRLVLHRLRQVLAPEGEWPTPILYEQGWVALNPSYMWDLDLDRFEKLIETADDDSARLEEAAALHRGEALVDEVYEDWATPYREHAARQWRSLCLRLASLHRARGEAERAVEWLERLLDADPLDEEALRELLIALEGMARRTDALRRFHKFEEQLAEELDVPPDAETLTVAARIAEHLRQTELELPAIPSLRSADVLPVAPSYSLSTVVPLIDREEAMGAIADLLPPGSRDSPRVLLLAAEAGGGKTRVLAEAAARARQEGVLTLAGGAYEHEGHLPYGPIHDALLDYVLTQPAALLKRQLEGLLPELARIVPELHLRIGSLAPGWSGDAEALRLRLFSAMAQVLGRIAGDRPLLLLLDDLHWADEGTLQLLHFLFRQRRRDPVLIIAAYRPEEIGSETPLARWLDDLHDDESPAIRMLSLPALNGAETTALLEERLRGPCAPNLGQTLHERSAGNPFFALQMLRLLQQEGRLEQTGEGWSLATSAGGDGQALPAKVRGTVARRMRKLAPEEREALAIGAVMGREFPYSAIETLWDGEESVMFRALEGAVNAHLLAETENGFAFRHPILREVVYDGVSRPRRVQLHRRAGFALQALYGPPDTRCEPQHTVQLAWHFLQGQVPEQAVAYALLAGDQAEAAFAHRQAEQQYRTALDLARQLDDGRSERRALEQLGGTLAVLGSYAEAENVLEQAAAGYTGAADAEGQRRAVAEIGEVHLKRGTLEQGMSRTTAALLTLDSDTPSLGLGALYLSLSSLAFHSGRYAEELEAAERAIEIARALGDTRLLVQAQLNRAYSLPWLGTGADFRHALEDVIVSAEEIDDQPTLLRALCAVAHPYAMMGEVDRAQQTLARALEIAERLGDPSRIAFTANVWGLTAYAGGEWDRAEELFSRSLALYRDLRAESDTMLPLFGLGEIHVSRGDWETGSAELEEHIRLAHLSGDLRWLHAAQALLAERDLLAGRPENALLRLESVTRLPNLSELALIDILPTLAWSYLELGDAERAALTAVDAAERAAGREDQQPVIDALRVQGMALARQQRWEEAETCFARALQLGQRLPYPYTHGRVLYHCGLMYAGRGQPDQARRYLQEALDVFQQLDARPYSDRAAQALADLVQPRVTRTEPA